MEPPRFDHVWAFDFGTASLGVAVRQGNEMRHAASLRLPEDFASTKDAAVRRRMWRTRQAHKAREERWREIAKEAGIEVLRGRQVGPVETSDGKKKWRQIARGDERLEREFPKKGDNTCYTSCLLRIKLLRGDTDLQPWQVFKAIHSALQHRGYDANIPWKERETRRTAKDKDDDEMKTQARAESYGNMLEEIAPGQPEFHHPCYLEAKRMGLWNQARPMEIKLRIDHSTQRARVDYKNGESVGHIASRFLVREETRLLLERAACLFPKLKGHVDAIMFGPGEKEYASYFSEVRKSANLRRGAASDWLGILGQKVPRFDNRILDQCKLIPEYHVCKAAPKKQADGLYDPASLLPAEVVFLLKLKNLRVARNGVMSSLLPEEIWTVFCDPSNPRKIEALPPPNIRDKAIGDAHPAPDEPDKYKLSEAGLKKWCVKLGFRPWANHEEVAPPNIAGRSRFCRPALALLKRLILSGESPFERYNTEVTRLHGNTDRRKGLVVEQIDFLRRLGDSWANIYVPNERLEQLGKDATTREQRLDAIKQLIGSVNNPVVRHRLGLFLGQLQKLELKQKFGVPDIIAMEFVREDFMGEKAKREYQKFLNDRAKQRAEAREKVAKLDAGKSASLKYELLKSQGCMCLYTGESLQQTKLDDLQIEHVVPRSRGGPDAVLNYVLTKRETNVEKGERTPFEWLHGQPGWDAYVERVKKHAGQLRNKKVSLLTSADACELVQKYTALAETAYIAKLAQTLVCLYFGWPRSGTEGTRHVIILSGGLTARIRRKYHLDGLLYGESLTLEELEKKTRNRDDDRHHALDAMVLSFLPGWARNPGKEQFFQFPFTKGEERAFFKREIAKIVPEWVGREKPVLAETIYGARKDDHGKLNVRVLRVPLRDLGYKSVNMKKVYDVKTARKATQSIRDPEIQKTMRSFLATEPTESQWQEFCESTRRRTKSGAPGPRIIRVMVEEGSLDETKNMSKDDRDRGAWRLGSKSHRGQIAYKDDEGKVCVRPVYVFESIQRVYDSLEKEIGIGKIIGFFRSKDLLELTRAVEIPGAVLPAGRYLLNSLRVDANLQLSDAKSNPTKVFALKYLLGALRHKGKDLS